MLPLCEGVRLKMKREITRPINCKQSEQLLCRDKETKKKMPLSMYFIPTEGNTTPAAFNAKPFSP